MANEINRIQINRNYELNSVGEKPQDKTNQKEEKEKQQIENKQVPAEDVLNFMNTQSLSARPIEKPRVLNISKYVTPEQAQRIAGFISQFEDTVAEGLISIEKELGNTITNEAKMNLAVEMFKIKNM